MDRRTDVTFPETPGKKSAWRTAGGKLRNGLLWTLGAGMFLARGGLYLASRAWYAMTAPRIENPLDPQPQPKRSDKMGLRHVFWGAALIGGILAGPGLYYMPQSNEIVRTRVTGKVQADLKSEFPGHKYFIYSRSGKFDTYAIPNGNDIHEGCVYDFNVKSARLQAWPPSYSRSIVGFKPVDGECGPK